MNKSIYKPLLIAILLCTAFTIGFQLADHVSAASWKKYDSGSYIEDFPPNGYSKYGKYQSYTQGSNKLYLNLYVYKKGTNQKHLVNKMTFTKKNNLVTIKDTTDFKYENNKNLVYTYSVKTKRSVKTVYKSTINEIKKSKPKETQAFDKHTHTTSRGTLKTYAIYSKTFNEVKIYAYINYEEVMTIFITKNKETEYDFGKNRKAFFDFEWDWYSPKDVYYDFLYGDDFKDEFEDWFGVDSETITVDPTKVSGT